MDVCYHSYVIHTYKTTVGLFGALMLAVRKMIKSTWFTLWLLVLVNPLIATTNENLIGNFFNSEHTNNWAVLIRHIANTLSIYRTVKRLGIPDSNIILMLSDDMPCNARNRYAGTVYNDANKLIDLYGDNIEVDYRGYEVTVENFIRLLTGRHEPHVPRSKRLLTDYKSNILIYMTGHGGDEFLKFQDHEEIGAYDISDSIAQMHEKKRYHEIFFIAETCEAASLYKHIRSPNVFAAASSLTGEKSYSHHSDSQIGVAVIDRFTYYTLRTLEKVNQGDYTTMNDLINSFDVALVASTPDFRTDLFGRDMNKTLITDFFGGVQAVELTRQRYPLGMTPFPSKKSKKSIKREQEFLQEKNLMVDDMEKKILKRGTVINIPTVASLIALGSLVLVSLRC